MQRKKKTSKLQTYSIFALMALISFTILALLLGNSLNIPEKQTTFSRASEVSIPVQGTCDSAFGPTIPVGFACSGQRCGTNCQPGVGNCANECKRGYTWCYAGYCIGKAPRPTLRPTRWPTPAP